MTGLSSRRRGLRGCDRRIGPLAQSWRTHVSELVDPWRLVGTAQEGGSRRFLSNTQRCREKRCSTTDSRARATLLRFG